MADPICRWRNSSLKQILEFNSLFPFKVISKEDGRKIVSNRWGLLGGSDFFTTPYQLAAQMGVYFEDGNYMYVRFDRLISIEEGLSYLFYWGKRYYAPNPYTKSITKSSRPVVINNFLVNWAIENGEKASFSEALKKMFEDEIGNTDILINMLNNFSEVVINDDKVLLKDVTKIDKYSSDEVYLEFDVNDKKSFFDFFNKDLIKEKVIFGPTQFGSNTNGYVSFLQKVLEEIIKDDPTLSRLTSEQENYALTNNGYFSIGGCIIGKKITMVENLRDGDYDLNLKWTFNDEEYVFYKELTGEGISKFSKIYNKVYNGFYKIIEKKDDKGHYVFTFVKCVKQNIKQYNGIWNSYFSAIKTKPFVLLAGISGTGKSRIVRQLARACDNLDENPWKVQKPKNFEMIQVKPNWHDSSELLGYVSRIDGEKYVAGDFLKFIVRAWENLDTPYFLCLDEMNLAPVEQYFAEYLSVIESRRLNEETGEIETDPIVKKEEMPWYQNLVKALLSKLEKKEALIKQFMEKGITIPQNLIVMGTVNMDETTFSFSRKVLDRAMTIEMNEVKLDGGLTEEDLKKEQFTISAEDIIPQVVEGKDVYGENKNLCDRVIAYLQKVNDMLDGTPFKIAYRTRNEFLIYAVNRGEKNYESAIDEMTSMKILSRIEGDAAKLINLKGESVLDGLQKLLIEVGLNVETSLSLQKINEMQKRLNTGYTSYWS